jgi:hypothetical protein
LGSLPYQDEVKLVLTGHPEGLAGLYDAALVSLWTDQANVAHADLFVYFQLPSDYFTSNELTPTSRRTAQV